MMAEKIILFYNIGVFVAMFLCVYEFLFEKDKIDKIHSHFDVDKNIRIAIMLFAFVMSMITSWFYVGRKISQLINKEDITKDL